MGIQGLLPFLKKCIHPASMKEYRGCTVAIDSYCWLHKGAFSCAEKLANNEPTDQYVYYCLKFVNMLLSYDIKPIMVFDGCRLPSKRDVEKQRRERRDMYRKKAAQLIREGKRAEARDCLTKCVDITPQMALELIKACRAKGVDCIVAPYEADAQLAYLSRIGAAQIIITEDSDLILFGCEKVMFKMDSAGNGMMLNKSELASAMEMRADCYSFEKFRYMCILSGCDYMPSLPGIGLKKAQKLMQRTRQPDMRQVLKKLPSLLNMNVSVSNEYIEGFIRADNTFLYQLVYDPTKRQLLPLTPYPEDLDIRDLNYAGPTFTKEKALQIALGNMDIYTGKLMDDFDPDNPVHIKQSKRKFQEKEVCHKKSIWDRDYDPHSQGNEQSSSASTNNVGKKTASTLGKVVTAKLPSTFKRPRPQEPEISENELAALYGGSPIKKARAESAPTHFLSAIDTNTYKEKKEPKTPSNISTGSKEALQSAAVDAKSKSNATTMRTTPESTKVPKATPESPFKSPSKQSVQQSPITPSPSKNPFRKKGGSGGKKFVLNEQKPQVVSRFFNKAKSLQKTEFGKELEKNLEKPFERPKPSWERENESDDENEESDEPSSFESKNDAQVTIEDSKDNVRVIMEPAKNKSPYSAFNQLSQFKSKFDPALKNSPGVGSSFKPVMSRSNPFAKSSSKKNSISEKFSLDASVDNVLDTASQRSATSADTSFESTTLESQKSIALNSIDGDSISLSQSFDRSQSQPSLPQLNDSVDSNSSSKTTNSQTTLGSFFYRKSTGGIEPSTPSSQSTPKSTTPPGTAGSSASNKKGLGRGSCRQSGLSKKSPAGRSKENPLHKFLFTPTPKQTMPKHKPLSPNNT